ncbi:MAG: hypothetical protein HKN73_16730 [Gemmatimonadetes bacterium]|nr:hypothetical protein [Gemmatimonadota bacterium]
MSLVRNQGTASTRFGRDRSRVEQDWPRSGGRFTCAVAAASLFILACGSPAPTGPSLRIRVAPTPPAAGTARIIVQVLGDGSVPVSGTVTGRPLPDGRQGPPRVAEESGPRALSVAEFDFPTSGPWRMVAEVRLSNGAVLRDSTDMTVVEALSPPPDPPEG